MSQHGLGRDQPKPDVGGDDPAAEGVAAERIFGRGAAGSQTDVNFTVFDGQDLKPFYNDVFSEIFNSILLLKSESES